jgi:gluconolactonase
MPDVDEDPFEVLDERFSKYTLPTVWVEKLFTGVGWAEGPAYFADTRCLLFSDVPGNRIMRWCEETGAVGVFRSPSNHSNGNTRDRQGRLITCEHQGRRVSRTEHSGHITVLADNYQGKKLNSPNDVVVKSDGTVWFTDPIFGIVTDHYGDLAQPEIGSSNVYCFDPRTAELSVVAGDFTGPNGLTFSPDESRLYIVDSGGPRHIRVFSVTDMNTLRDGRIFATVSPGSADGLRVDIDGNIWTSAGDGVHAISPEGDLIGKIRFPHRVANLCFGGPKRNRLFVCGHRSLYAIYLNTRGVQVP